jgi:hypothetical protein
VGAQPEWCTQNPHHGEHNGRRRHGRESKGPGAEAPRSGARDVPLILTFQALADTVRNTTEELHSVAAQYVASNKEGQLHLAPSDIGEASSNVTIQDTGEGGRKRHKQHLQEATTVVNDDGGNGKQAGSSGTTT